MRVYYGLDFFPLASWASWSQRHNMPIHHYIGTKKKYKNDLQHFLGFAIFRIFLVSLRFFCKISYFTVLFTSDFSFSLQYETSKNIPFLFKVKQNFRLYFASEPKMMPHPCLVNDILAGDGKIANLFYSVESCFSYYCISKWKVYVLEYCKVSLKLFHRYRTKKRAFPYFQTFD